MWEFTAYCRDATIGREYFSQRVSAETRGSRGLLKQDLYRQPVVHLFPTPTCGGRVFVNVHTVPLVHHWQFSPIGKRPQP